MTNRTYSGISVIIVSWNVQEYLRHCLYSLEADHQCSNYEIIVVDNNSTDDSVVMLRKEFPEVKLIQNKTNTGFAKANNQGINLSKGEFILLLNPDTQVAKGSISKLLLFLRNNEDVGIVGPKLLNPDGTLQASGLNFPALTNNLFGYFRVRKAATGAYFLNTDKSIVVDALVGACLLVKREVIEQVGGFDEDYFMYVEEADWCYRIRQAGWSICYVPSAEVIHYGGQSSKHVPAHTYVALRKSRILFVLKHHSRIQAILLSLGYLINASFKKVLARNNKQIFRQVVSEFSSITIDLFLGKI